MQVLTLSLKTSLGFEIYELGLAREVALSAWALKSKHCVLTLSTQHETAKIKWELPRQLPFYAKEHFFFPHTLL